MEKFVVIMAGGSGTRFWPLSRETRPKQFICIDEGNCMLVQTIERICEIVPADKCFIITNKHLLDITWDTVKDLIPYSNIILEPEKKNTAACIAFATLLLKERFGEGLLCFVPADGYVKDRKAYKNAIELAYIAAERTDDLVIIGITPTYPATGYGYIQIDNDIDAQRISTVLRFIEKPDLETAKKLVASGDFLWNGGILVGSMDAILGSIDALSKTLAADAEGNTIKGKHFGIDTSNSVIVGEDTLITTIDIDNMIVASTKDAILVCPRNKAQDVKTLFEKLKSNGYGDLS